MFGIHGACHFAALDREPAVHLTLAHTHLPPAQQRGKEKRVPMSGNGQSATGRPVRDQRRWERWVSLTLNSILRARGCGGPLGGM